MKYVKHYFLMAAGLAVFVGIVSAVTAGPAIAQLVKAALVKNADERGRIPYTFIGSCQQQGGCFVTAPPVPAGKRLVLEHVSARLFNFVPTQSVAQAFVGDGERTVAYPHFVFVGTVGQAPFQDSAYTLNESVLIYVEAGKTPQFSSGTDSEVLSTLDISMTGYLVDLSI